MKLIGIDPGLKGAIAELNVLTKLCRWMKLPWREDGILDARVIRSIFDLDGAGYIYVEKLSPMPAWGTKNFSFGYNYGQVRQMLEEYPYELVAPGTWQRSMISCPKAGKTKEMAASSFRKMNPNFGKITKDEHEGLIDAFFIGYFGGKTNCVIMPTNWEFCEESQLNF